MSTNPPDQLDNESPADQLARLEAMSTKGMNTLQQVVRHFRMNSIRATLDLAVAEVRRDTVLDTPTETLPRPSAQIVTPSTLSALEQVKAAYCKLPLAEREQFALWLSQGPIALWLSQGPKWGTIGAEETRQEQGEG